MCLDFWRVLPKGDRDYGGSLFNRYPFSSCAQRAPSLFKMTWPGPEGAETTVRFEAFVEGVQEAEANIMLNEAIAKHADKLGEELPARSRQVLADRLRYFHTRDQMQWTRVYFHMNHYGWQDLSRRLLDCAAEARKKLGS